MIGSSSPSNPRVSRMRGSASGRGFRPHGTRNTGHKGICRFPLVAARKLIIEITEADRPAALRAVELHNSTGLAHQH